MNTYYYKYSSHVKILEVSVIRLQYDLYNTCAFFTLNVILLIVYLPKIIIRNIENNNNYVFEIVELRGIVTVNIRIILQYYRRSVQTKLNFLLTSHKKKPLKIPLHTI